MALILKAAVRLYYYLNEDIADPRTQNWFLMRTPWPGAAIIVLYLVSVLHWLPAYMRWRPAYDLRRVIALYNATQIFMCGYVVYKSLVLGWFSHYRLFCQPVDEGPNGIEYAWHACYGYFFIKIIDLLDTVFFILRKKQEQVTFLHVYHHFGMIMVAWGITKWVPGGHMTMLVTLNSFVHMVMYTYYLLTSWDETYKHSLWWKKHVTQLQLAQFSYLMLHFGALAVQRDCDFPRPCAYIMFPQNLFMVLMFGDFYYRTYIKNAAKKPAKTTSESKGSNLMSSPKTTTESKGSNLMSSPKTTSESKGSNLMSLPKTTSESKGSNLMSLPKTTSESKGSNLMSSPKTTSESKGSNLMSSPNTTSESKGSNLMSSPKTTSESKGSNLMSSPVPIYSAQL